VQAWQKLIIVAVLATIIVVAGTLVYFNYFSKRRLFISTTTSLYDTGLLDAIEADYESTHTVDLQITAVGTGIAIEQAENGDADVVLVHAPSVELDFLEGG
jgi:tungstate transport system substrate-binding protein